MDELIPSQEEMAEAFSHYDQGTMMADIALFTMAVLPIIVGSWRSVQSLKDLREEAKETAEKVEVMTTKDALTFPVYASCTLLTLYVLIKMIGPEYATLLLTIYISAVGIGAVAIAYAPIFTLVVSSKGTYCLKLTEWPNTKKAEEADKSAEKSAKKKAGQETSGDSDDADSNETEHFALEFTNAHIVSLIFSVIATAIYLTTKHWVANNLIGLGFAIAGVQFFALNEFKIGAVLLSILFFYDIFWVFYTDVMVTVAKNFDAPIKVTFPRDFPENGFASTQLALLGLGDIVLPGALIALLLRFDNSRRKGSFLYFGFTLTFYMLGLLVTGFVMHFYKHAQPALLYLVPACLFAPLFLATIKGELGLLFRYRDIPEDEQKKDGDGDKKKEEEEKKEK